MATQLAHLVETSLDHACALAAHRGAKSLNAKDLALHLETAWDLRVPGFAADPKTLPEDAEQAKTHEFTLVAKRQTECKAAAAGSDANDAVGEKRARSASPPDDGNAAGPRRRR
jgi:transcription initiation factor TFIID subunit TAF12